MADPTSKRRNVAVRSRTWDRGRNDRPVSVSQKSMNSVRDRTLLTKLMWLSMTPLGSPGRPRGVDDGGEVPGPDRIDRPLEPPGIDGLGPATHLHDVRQGVRPGRRIAFDDDDPLEGRECVPHGLDLGVEVEVRDDDDLGPRVLEDVADLVGHERCVDGDGGGARAERREVGHDPLGPVLGDDGDPVAGLQPELPETEGQVPDGRFDLVRGYLFPDTGPLEHHPVGLFVGPAGTEEKAAESGHFGFGHGGSLLSRGDIIQQVGPAGEGGDPSPPGRQRSRMSLMSSAALSAKAGWPAARRARSRARSKLPAL